MSVVFPYSSPSALAGRFSGATVALFLGVTTAYPMQVNLGSGGPTHVYDGRLELSLINRFDTDAGFDVSMETKDGMILVEGEDYKVREDVYRLGPDERALVQLKFRPGDQTGRLRVCVNVKELGYGQAGGLSSCGRFIVHGYGGTLSRDKQ